MKINEISIGDKVQILGRRRIYTVTEVKADGQILLEANGNFIDVAIERIKPKELTPFILEENGFECYGDVWKTCWRAVGEDGDDDLEVVFKDDGSIQTKFDVAGLYTSTCKIKYVHQLQHLLRLCELDDLKF